MGNSRQDIQRLFGHFGLDPADYVEGFSRSAAAPAASASAKNGSAGKDNGISGASDVDLFDYRNFELRR